jgi:phage protein D
LTVEQSLGVQKFSVTFKDERRKWSDSGLFEVGKTAEIHLGYAGKLETVVKQEIGMVKTIIFSNGPPQIEVSGETLLAKSLTLITSATTAFALSYGIDLLSFTGVATAEKQPTKTATALRAPAVNLQCTAESMGYPDIKPGVTVALGGLGEKFNKSYVIQKATHTLDDKVGYRTKFEGKA